MKYVWLLLAFFTTFITQASSTGEVQSFLNKENVKTYDCPADDAVPKMETFLSGDIRDADRIDLLVFKGHWLICVGKFDQAKRILQGILDEGEIDKTSRSYASLTYQLGFMLDTNSDPKSCQYYQQSKVLAKNKFRDIYLSSQLGLITVCGENKQDIGVKLGHLFALVKMYSAEKDTEALAHIHNNIGLFYSSIGQMGLAAEQYEKSYRLGLDVYEAKNSLAPLISVISAYTGSGDYEKAALMIEELRLGNLKVNTPLTNNWYHYAQSRHFYRTGDYDAMAKSMASWRIFLDQTSNKTLERLYQWYSAALCLHNKERACVETFLREESGNMPERISKHIHFIRFLVQANLFLEDIQGAENAFAEYANIVSKKENVQQESAKVLGVANLHSEIFLLEESLLQAEKRRYQTILVIIGLIVLIVLLAYLTVGRSYLKRLATDQLTGLQNEQSVLSKIKRVSTPVNGKVNALALFDVNNFTEVNQQFGFMTGETLLKKVAQCLAQVTRDKDIVGRVGADQFIVCLKNVEERTANELFQRILTSLTSLAINNGRGESVNIQSSMNIYSSDGGLSDLDDVLTEIRLVLAKGKRK